VVHIGASWFLFSATRPDGADKSGVSETAGAIPSVAKAERAAGETEAWRKLTSMTLEALAKGPVEFSGDERNAFTSRLRDSMAALDGQAKTSQILLTAGSLTQAIEQYNGQTQRRFNGLVDQFRELTRVLLERGPGLPPGLQRSIESALALQELPELEQELGQSLEAARAAPRAEAPALSRDSREQVTRPPAPLPMRARASPPGPTPKP
jgi:hypothetical protein